jgi:cyclic pyranopterin monophosphate synthase
MADEPRLSHIDPSGRARMVDVGDKRESDRRARARARVRMSPETAVIVERGDAPKGDVIGTARIAGIQAAKRTDELIPLAHPLPISFIDIEAEIDSREGTITFTAEARTTARTGVEMEALTAAAVAALAAYDMVKGIERGVLIEEVALLQKTGGKEDWSRDT